MDGMELLTNQKKEVAVDSVVRMITSNFGLRMSL